MIVRRAVSTVVRVGDPYESCTRIGGEQVACDEHGEPDLTRPAILRHSIASLILIAQAEDLLESRIRQNLIGVFVVSLVLTGFSTDTAGRRNLGHSVQNFPAFRQSGILRCAVILASTEGIEYAGGVEVESRKARMQHSRPDLRTPGVPQIDAYKCRKRVGAPTLGFQFGSDDTAECRNFSQDCGIQCTASLCVVLSGRVNE